MKAIDPTETYTLTGDGIEVIQRRLSSREFESLQAILSGVEDSGQGLSVAAAKAIALGHAGGTDPEKIPDLLSVEDLSWLLQEIVKNNTLGEEDAGN